MYMLLYVICWFIVIMFYSDPRGRKIHVADQLETIVKYVYYD